MGPKRTGRTVYKPYITIWKTYLPPNMNVVNQFPVFLENKPSPKVRSAGGKRIEKGKETYPPFRVFRKSVFFLLSNNKSRFLLMSVLLED